MIFLSSNIITYLNAKYDAGDALLTGLTILALWSLIWRLFLGKWLYKHNASSFWYAIYEFGPVGSFSIILFLVILFVLFIASIQAVLEYGAKMILTLAVFWSIVIGVPIIIVKNIKKKKNRPGSPTPKR